jgi:L-threonylcarbamoyladenylate synthase
MLASHYAPRALLRLNAAGRMPHEALLAFGDTSLRAAVSRNLSPTGNLEEAARNLYAMLRALDATGCPRIAVTPIPEEGVGVAINDRLRRAAAPRN